MIAFIATLQVVQVCALLAVRSYRRRHHMLAARRDRNRVLRNHLSEAQQEIEHILDFYGIMGDARLGYAVDGALFKDLYRVNQDTFQFVVNEISLHPVFVDKASGRPRSLPPDLALKLFLLRMGNRFPSLSLVARFHQVSKSSAQRLINYCGKAIVDSLERRFVRFPVSEAERQHVAEGFRSLAGFPGVLGALDGTHVRISAPAVPEAEKKLYWCRHQEYSVVLSAIVDAKGRFIHTHFGFPGSCHDSYVFERTSFFGSLAQLVPLGFHLVADSAYTLRQEVMCQYRETLVRTPAQRLFSLVLARTRQPAERSFGMLQTRFRALGGQLEMALDKLQYCVRAATVLHNICLERLDAVEHNMFWQVQPQQGGDPGQNQVLMEEGVAKRRRLEAEFFATPAMRRLLNQ